ncbi:MAG: Phage gp6-like head-tail connector protein [Burkholderiaceae bacterium]|nr:Phage gp6-like head-tail connector protein [Burkholderiaceae bacterium]
MITMSEAKTHLRMDGDDLDTEIQIAIDAAVSYAESFCKQSFTGANAVTSPPSVKAAALLMVGDYIEGREIPSQASKSLMWPHRMQGF